jgi:hypothetical protein
MGCSSRLLTLLRRSRYAGILSAPDNVNQTIATPRRAGWLERLLYKQEGPRFEFRHRHPEAATNRLFVRVLKAGWEKTLASRLSMFLIGNETIRGASLKEE